MHTTSPSYLFAISWVILPQFFTLLPSRFKLLTGVLIKTCLKVFAFKDLSTPALLPELGFDFDIMSVQIFENESTSSASDVEEEDGDPLGIVISNKKRGSLFDIFDGKIGSGKRGSIFDGKRPSIFQLEGKRGSIFQLEGKSPMRSPILCDYENKKRGSIFQLFDDPYRFLLFIGNRLNASMENCW